MKFQTPPDWYQENKRKCVKWTKGEDLPKPEPNSFYQGEVNESGNRDGKGVTVFAGAAVVSIAYYKDGVKDGQELELNYKPMDSIKTI